MLDWPSRAAPPRRSRLTLSIMKRLPLPGPVAGAGWRLATHNGSLMTVAVMPNGWIEIRYAQPKPSLLP